MHKTFKFRIYPTKIQQEFLSQQFGGTRFIYNYFLNQRKEEYLKNKKSSSYYDNCKGLTKLKKQEEYAWLNNINAQSLQSSLRDLEVAYTRFFSKKSKFPKFHSKSNRQCFKIPQAFKIKGDLLFIPKLKHGIKINLHQPFQGNQLFCFIEKTATNKYYAGIVCDTEMSYLDPNANQIGIDVGLSHFLTDNNGNTVENPRFYQKLEKKLRYQNRQLSKKKLGSNNRNKAKKQLSKTHEKITNSRKDFIHKVSRRLINENQVIIAEDLSVIKMMKSNLAKSIFDASWAELFRQLKYKAEWYGRIFYQVDKFFPSSKTCNNCQFVVDELPLNIRHWTCPNCQQSHDRDVNAAKNILDKGLSDLMIQSGSGTESDSKQKLGEANSLELSVSQEISDLG